MRLLGRCAGALALALAAACSSAESTSAAGGSSTSTDTTSGGTVAFVLDGPLTLAPGALHTLDVVVTPARRASVRFALLGDALGASLDRVSLETDDAGRGQVTLRAPDAATTFRLRAALDGGGSAEAEIAVSDQGFATVEVVPLYAGERAHDQWTASVVARATCASLQALLPDDPPGGLSASSAARPIVSGVPVGPSLAVAVRSGRSMWGCTDAAAIAANQTLEVRVNVVDRPIDLATTELDLTFAYAPDPVAYGALLGATCERLAEAALPSGLEASTLLDGMAAMLAGADADAFAKQREALGWDAAVAAVIGDGGTALRGAIASLARAGLAAQPPSFTAHLSAVPGTAGHALLAVRRLGDVDADVAGVPSAHLASFAATADDTLQLGATVYWLPSRFAGAAAVSAAKAAVPTAKTMADALAAIAPCDELATLLGDAGACDAACLAAACHDAIAARWAVAIDASIADATVGEIAVVATAAAELDADARPTGFVGSWLGSVRVGDDAADVSGAVSATQPMAPPPY